MKAKKWQRAVSLFLCLLMVMSFFVVTAPKAYADEGETTEVTRPQLKESGGLTFKDTNGEDKLVPKAYNYLTGNDDFTFTSADATIRNYDELQSVPGQTDTEKKKYYLVGEIELNYKDALLAAPSNSSLNPKNDCVFNAVKDADNNVINASNSAIILDSGENYMRVFVVKEKLATKTIQHLYYYRLKIVGSKLLAHYPDTWTADETGTKFVFSSAEYIDSYASWDTTSKIIPTWGTTASKDKLNFTNGSDTFTLTNLEGKSQEYTVRLDMPWEFKVLPQKGYDLSALSAGTEKLSGYEDLSKAYSTVTKDIRSDRAVTMSIKPTGENKNMVIDKVTLTKSRDKTAISASDITITGNTFSFVMPNDCVEVTSITFKEDTSERYTISASAMRYRDENIYVMGTVTVTDGEKTIGDAHAGNEVTVTATPWSMQRINSNLCAGMRRVLN